MVSTAICSDVIVVVAVAEKDPKLAIDPLFANSPRDQCIEDFNHHPVIRFRRVRSALCYAAIEKQKKNQGKISKLNDWSVG